MNAQQKVPVSILTGFLGSGKTTLLNRILSEEHGKRIAVIENEYGEVGIDQALVIDADEEVFEMSNGCICCTVRGDLIRVLGNLMKRRDKFDYVLVETTGLADGPDPEMSLIVTPDQGADDAALREGAEWCVRRYAEPAEPVRPGEALSVGKHLNLELDSPGRKSFLLELDARARLGLYAQHTAEEFDLQLANAQGATINPEAERTWVAQHEHDDEVGSISIERDGDVDPGKLEAWLGGLLAERGVDIFRMKGFISLAGESRRFVFQGVHMLFDGQPDRPWGDSPRRNRLVFIGRKLDEKSMRQGFEECLA